MRFFRWDGAGVIVSQSSAWKEKPEDLLKFFLYLASCTMKEQSYDPTTRLVRARSGGSDGGSEVSPGALKRAVANLRDKYSSNKWTLSFLNEMKDSTETHPSVVEASARPLWARSIIVDAY